MQWGDQQVQRTAHSVSDPTITASSSSSSQPSYPSSPSQLSYPSPHQTVFSQTPLPIETQIQFESACRSNTAFGMYALTPPFTDPLTTMQRADEINTIQRMMGDKQTSAVMIIGVPGAGKSTLLALLYRRLQLAKREHLPTPKYLVWLTIGTYTTLPDIIAAILNSIGAPEPGLFLLKPEQQISTLLRALRRPHENALIILDQFELLLHPETNQGVAGRGVLPLFLDMLQTDLGISRILLTSYHSPYDGKKISDPRVRSYLVTRISLPEGVGLMQQRGIQGTQEELSSVWQRCSGHVFALVLCSALRQLRGHPLSHLLNAPEYKPMWGGDIILNLITAVHYFLNPTQSAIMHSLSLFHEPTSKDGIFMTIAGDTTCNYRKKGNHNAVAIFENELSRLVQLGLLSPIAQSRQPAGPPNYTLHPLLRQYILEHFMDDDPQLSLSDRRTPPWPQNAQAMPDDKSENHEKTLAAGHEQVAKYYRHVIEEHCPPRDQRTSLQDIAPIVETIRHLCQGHRWQHACDLLLSEHLHEDMEQWGAWNTLIGLYTAMLPPFGQLQRSDEGLINSNVGMLYGRIGEHQQSKLYIDKALQIQRQVGDHYGEAITLTNLGELQRVRGEYQQAQQSFELALTQLGSYEDNALRSVIAHNLGLLSQQNHDYTQAYDHYTEALRQAYLSQSSAYIGMILSNLGMLLYEQRHFQEALALLFEALSMRQNQQDPTVTLLERFLIAIEQKMGSAQYAQLSKEAISIQSQVLYRFTASDMRQ